MHSRLACSFGLCAACDGAVSEEKPSEFFVSFRPEKDKIKIGGSVPAEGGQAAPGKAVPSAGRARNVLLERGNQTRLYA